MNISSSTAILHPEALRHCEIELKQIPQLFHEAGFDSIDWSLWNFCINGKKQFTGLMLEDNWKEQIEYLAMIDDQEGLPCLQTHCVSVNPINYQRFDRTLLRKLELRCIEASSILGAQWMVIHPFVNLSIEHATSKDHIAFFSEYLKPLIDHAYRFHVGIAIENMIQYSNESPCFCATAVELKALLDSIHDPLVGCCWDTGHGNLSGQKQHSSIILLKDHLCATHIDDNFGRDHDDHLLPNEGTIQWNDVIRALKEIGYANEFAFEHTPIPMEASVIPYQLQFMAQLGRTLLSRT